MNFRAATAAVLCGVASGARSFSGIAALAVPLTRSTQPHLRIHPGTGFGSLTEKPWPRRLLLAACVGELALDKLPTMQSRLAPLGIVTRAAGATACGMLIAESALEADPGVEVGLFESARSRVHAAGHAAAAVVAAGGAAVLGLRLRKWAAARIGIDAVAAVIEDTIALALAGVAARILHPNDAPIPE